MANFLKGVVYLPKKDNQSGAYTCSAEIEYDLQFFTFFNFVKNFFSSACPLSDQIRRSWQCVVRAFVKLDFKGKNTLKVEFHQRLF